MTPEQEAQLLETVTATNTRINMLISEDGRGGIVPEMKINHAILEQAVAKHDTQIAYWKGAIAVVGFLLVVFGAVLATHLLGGK